MPRLDVESVKRFFAAKGREVQWPTEPWHEKKRTPKAACVRVFLMKGFLGGLATVNAGMIDAVIGPDEFPNDICVSIPFRTKHGAVVTLFGGHIHAIEGVTWDVLGDDGDHEDERFPAGLSCLKTEELIRAIRSL